jgi:hypothetical protein
MLYAFIDESYTQDRYYMSAFVVDEDHLGAVSAAAGVARKYAEGFGIPEDAELHAYQIMSGRGEWKPIRGNHRAAIAIYGNALRQFAGLPTGKLFVSGVDVVRLNARYRYPDPPHRATLRYLLEAVDRYAKKVKQRVVIIADEVPDQESHGQRMADYQLIGTGGYRPSKLESIDMPINFGSSAQSPGLQASDLMVYAFRRLDAHTESNVRARAAVEGLWAITEPIRESIRRWDP